MSLRDLLRKPFANKASATPVALDGKHAIVTGCSEQSLGYATAEILARWGATVILTTRQDSAPVANAIKATLKEEGIDAKVDSCELDLCDAASVNSFSQWYLDRYGERLDILVNNAGIHLDVMSRWTEPKRSADGFEIQWRTNYLGSAHLTHKLLPLLKTTGQAHGEARVVNVVSQMYSRGSNEALFNPDTPYNSMQSYGLSKLGMIHHANELQRRYRESHGIKAFSLHPGSPAGTSTRVADKGFEGVGWINAIRKLGAPLERLFMSTPAEGAQTQVYCATSPYAVSGLYYQHCAPHECSVDASDQQAAKRLWEETAPWLDQVSNDA